MREIDRIISMDKPIDMILSIFGKDIRYIDKSNGYVTSDKMYLITECRTNEVEQCIKELRRKKFRKNKVICTDGKVDSRQRLEAINNHIEIMDSDTVYEIRENLKGYASGYNIPAATYGSLKINLLSRVKNKASS